MLSVFGWTRCQSLDVPVYQCANVQETLTTNSGQEHFLKTPLPFISSYSTLSRSIPIHSARFLSTTLPVQEPLLTLMLPFPLPLPLHHTELHDIPRHETVKTVFSALVRCHTQEQTTETTTGQPPWTVQLVRARPFQLVHDLLSIAFAMLSSSSMAQPQPQPTPRCNPKHNQCSRQLAVVLSSVALSLFKQCHHVIDHLRMILKESAAS